MPTTPTHLIPWPEDPGLPRRLYPGRNFRQDNRDQWADAGYFVDYETDAARRFVFMVRTTVHPKPTIAQIAEHYGFQHKLNAYSAYNTWQRRLFGSTPAPQLRPTGDPRSYVRRRYVQIAADGTVDRSFGIELEFVHAGSSGSHRHPQLATIIAGMRSGGYRATAVRYGTGSSIVAHDQDDYWAAYGTSPDLQRGGYWQGSYDGSIGMEFVSPPLPVTTEGLDQITTACRLIRENGGEAARGQGTHVHIGTGDLDSDGRLRLVTNVQIADRFLSAYTPETRRHQSYCAPMSSYDWQNMAEAVRSRGHGQNNHYAAYNFGHIAGRSDRNGRNLGPGSATIEFRAMGHTLNATKLRVWVRVVAAIVDATAAGHTLTATTLDEFLAQLRAHGGLSEFAATRFAERARRQVRSLAA